MNEKRNEESARALYTNKEYERDANTILKPLEGLSDEEVALVIADRLRRAVEIFITKRAANYGQLQSLMVAYQSHHHKER